MKVVLTDVGRRYFGEVRTLLEQLGTATYQEAVNYMVDAIRREDWDFMFPPHAAANAMRALQLPKPELNQCLKKRIFEGTPT